MPIFKKHSRINQFIQPADSNCVYCDLVAIAYGTLNLSFFLQRIKSVIFIITVVKLYSF